MRAALIGVVLFAATVFAQASATPKLGYQGRLLAADGTPAQGMVVIRFDFFAAATGGTSLWNETQTLALTDGLYSTFLGEVTAIPAGVFDGSERWLELTIGGTALTPRQQVASVPYALLARDPRLLASCVDGEVLKWSSSQTRWSCAPDLEGVSISTLSNYVTQASLTTTLASYATTASVQSQLASYATTASLASYVTTAALNQALSGYVSSPALAAQLQAYATTTALNTSLSNYVTTAALTTALANLPPSPTTCTGPGLALQWNGTAWQCVDVRATGPSSGLANGYEVRDDWGDAWDGVQRPARSWTEANAVCLGKGGRLPTVTELWRNRATYGTGNVGGPNDTAPLWTVAPGYQPNSHATCNLANGSVSFDSDTNFRGYRCIWKSDSSSAFTGKRCYGPPGNECKSTDAFFNLDRWSRAPQYFASALKECDLENGAMATAEDFEKEIQRGAEFVSTPDHTWPAWHNTSSATTLQSNGYSYIRLLRWSLNPEPGWGPDPLSASIALPSDIYSFRCIGKKSPGSGSQPASPACLGGCFQTTARTRLIADSINRPAANWNTAFKACAALGGSLPTAEEFNQLVPAGWPNGSFSFLWSATPASLLGWQLYRWTGTGSPLWNPYYDWAVGAYNGSFAPFSSSFGYRCVWRETSAPSLVSCAAGQVQLRDGATGADSCVNSVNGDSNGQAFPSGIHIVDSWGNAFDTLQRPAATYGVAKTTCEGLGGRLPLATELYRVRANQALGVVLGDVTSTSYLWTLNPDYRTTHQTQLRLSDGASTADVLANVAAFRCVWPATRPTAFSGHACYGLTPSRCFEAGRLRTDSYPRAAITQPAAQWECRYLGGRLPSVREQAELQHASLPNSAASVYEWTREWALFDGSTTLAFTTARGTNSDRTLWSFDGNERSWNWEYNLQPFRCVFTDLME